MKTKRLIISTLVGLVFGIASYGFASSGANFVSTSLAVSIILSRTLLGFAIGVSTLKFSHWALHGIIIGLIISLPLAAFEAVMGGSLAITQGMLMVFTLVFGMVYGFLIELVTTVILQAKQVRPKKSIL